MIKHSFIDWNQLIEAWLWYESNLKIRNPERLNETASIGIIEILERNSSIKILQLHKVWNIGQSEENIQAHA